MRSSHAPRGLLLPVLGYLAAGAAIAGIATIVVRHSELGVSWALIALVVLAIVTAMALARLGLWPEPEAPSWHVRLDDDSHPLDRERRAVRLADQCRGAAPGERFSTRELHGVLATITADRLVRHHAADPLDPFAQAAPLLSPALYAYLTSPDPVPALRRGTLAAHLKEIDAL